MNSKKCSTCIHWKDPDKLNENYYFTYLIKGYKICTRQLLNNPDDMMMPVADWWDCSEIHTEISTGPNFCCKHYLSRR